MNVYCPNCENACSDKAPACPKCGHPLAASPEAVDTAAESERTLCQARPSWKIVYERMTMAAVIAVGVGVFSGLAIENVYLGFMVFASLAVVSGALLVVAAWINRLGTVLIITNKRCILRKGIVSRSATEVRHVDIRNIQVNQGIICRILSIGHIGISSAGQSDVEIKVSGFSDPIGIRNLVDTQRACLPV